MLSRADGEGPTLDAQKRSDCVGQSERCHQARPAGVEVAQPPIVGAM